MSRLRRFGLAVLVAGGCVGCGGDGDSGPVALFELPGTQDASGFYALPFPNDARVADDGRIDMADHPAVNALVEDYLAVIQDKQRGFSLTAPAFFRFSEPIDPATLPATPADSVALDASVYLVNVDPGSASKGQRVPIRTRFELEEGEAIGANWLAVLPYPGFVLDEGTTYAAVVTHRVAGSGGDSLSPSATFARIAGEGSVSSDAETRARTAYQPLWDWLDEAGDDDRAQVVSAAVFTTQQATPIMGRIRDVIHRDVPVPAARQVTLVGEQAGYALYDGLFDGPRFQTGSVPYTRIEDGGEIAVDDSGDPIVQGMDELRFSFSVPLGTVPPDGWPIVVYAHGTGGSYHSFANNRTAERLAAQGLAVISMDQVFHGPRNPGGSPDVAFFNFQNPLAARDNTLQAALDDFQLLRLAVALSYTDPASGREVRFDETNVSFFGHSQGGLTGVPFVAYEPMVRGAVLSGTGGLLYLSLLNKVEPIDIAGLVGVLLRDDPLDEFNPILGLLQLWVERSDSASYARYISLEPPSGQQAKHVFLSLGHTDRFTPVPSIEAMAIALGVPPVEPVLETLAGMDVAQRDSVAVPVTGNLNGVTGGVLQYRQAPGSDGHFVLFDVPQARTQSIEFLGSLAATGAATIVAP